MARLPTKKKGLAVIQVTVVAAADRERIIAIVRDHKAAEGAEILTGLDPVTFSVNFTEYNPATVFALMEAIKDLRGVADVRSTLQKKSRFSLSLKTRRRLESGFRAGVRTFVAGLLGVPGSAFALGKTVDLGTLTFSVVLAAFVTGVLVMFYTAAKD